nr:MAG TPA: hypothetical protein [Caudoviricetes sp.]
MLCGKTDSVASCWMIRLNAFARRGSIRSIDTLYSKYISSFDSFNIFGIHKQQAQKKPTKQYKNCFFLYSPILYKVIFTICDTTCLSG